MPNIRIANKALHVVTLDLGLCFIHSLVIFILPGFLTNVACALTLDDIAAQYRTNYSAIDSVRIEYEKSFSPVGSLEILYEHWKMLHFGKEQAILVASKKKMHFATTQQTKAMDQVIGLLKKEQPGRFKNVKGDLGQEVTYAEIARLLPKITPKRSDRTLVYDGEFLRERSPFTMTERDGKAYTTYLISDPQQQSGNSFSINFLDMMLYGFDIEGLGYDSQSRARNRLPELLALENFSLTDTAARINGSDCVLIEAPDYGKIWLDKDLGYAVRRYEWTKNGVLLYSYECDEFEKVVDRVWIPHVIISETCGDDRVPLAWQGKKMLQTIWKVNVLEVNDPNHEKYFQLTPEPGSKVLDRTLNATNSRGSTVDLKQRKDKIIPSVGYVQPADQADVEKAVKQAQASVPVAAEFGSPGNANGGRWRTLTVLLNVAIVITLVTLLVIRKRAESR